MDRFVKTLHAQRAKGAGTLAGKQTVADFVGQAPGAGGKKSGRSEVGAPSSTTAILPVRSTPFMSS